MDHPMDDHINSIGFKSIEEAVVTMEELSLETPSHINHSGDPHIPFYAYLKQSILLKYTASHPVEFHRYSQLPLELQLLILEECDAQTLFSLMRTCSTIRAQTKKLFWSHETPWYYASAAWRQRPGVPGATELCPEFASQIEQVELDFWPVAVGSWRHDLLGTNNSTSDDDRLAQNLQAASV